MKEEFALIPEHISQFTGLADIFVETGAGLGSGFTDEDLSICRCKNCTHST